MISLEYLRVLVEFYGKRHENSKIWDFRGSYAASKVHVVTKLLFTTWKIVVFWFCFVSVARRTRLLVK